MVSNKNKEDLTFNQILEDNTSGSTELVLKLNKLIRSKIGFFSEIKSITEITREKFNSFAVITSYLDELEALLSEQNKQKLLEFTNSFEADLENKYLNLYQNSKPYLAKCKTILTLSNSTTLIEIFKLWFKDFKDIRIIIAESRPQNEGRILAKKLLETGIPVTFITDAMMSIYISEIDAVFIGADKVLQNGNVVNKTGSVLAASIANSFAKPFYVLTTANKFSNQINFLPIENSPEEVWNFQDSLLKISNIYFEEIPARLITKIITEKEG